MEPGGHASGNGNENMILRILIGMGIASIGVIIGSLIIFGFIGIVVGIILLARWVCEKEAEYERQEQK